MTTTGLRLVESPTALVCSLAALAVAASLALGGCPHEPPLPEVKELTLAQAEGRLRKEAERRQRLTGLAKARLSGLAGLVAAADLDVLAEVPGRLHLAVRSFFGPPLRVLATDGYEVTLYDGTGNVPRFYAGPAEEDTASLLLGVPLRPEEVVALVLGRPPGGQAKRHEMLEGGKGYRVLFTREGDDVEVTADAEDVVREVVVRRQGQERFQVRYDDFVPTGGVRLARTLEIRVLLGGEVEELVVQLKNPELNGPPLSDEVFSVGLPPGASFEPLPPPSQLSPLGG